MRGTALLAIHCTLHGVLFCVVLFCVLLCVGCTRSVVIDDSRLVDLTHAFNRDTVYWPTARKFRLVQVAFGLDAAGRWYASNDYSASEHGGTHLDAPIHFAKNRRTTEQIPLGQLVGPARVIDIRDRCAVDRDYLLSPDDILEHEGLHGRITSGSCVLVWTGFDRYWPGVARYLGSDRPGDVENLHFPGIGPEAARLLVDRRVDLVGIDTASLDHGPSRTFETHRILCDANIPGLENLAHLGKLPARGATLIALPMKIEKGTGGPCRVIALLP